MRLHHIDPYSRLGSLVHRIPAAIKLVVALILLAAILLCPQTHLILLLIPAALLLGIAALSRIPPGFLLQRLLLLEPLVLCAGLLVVFQPGGWFRLLVLALRSTLSLFTMILLANTTPFGELLHVLRKIRVPALLITTLALMYRYLFVLVDEAQRMNRARASRTFIAKRSWSWKITATVASRLFVRASERAERIYTAMCARGWQ